MEKMTDKNTKAQILSAYKAALKEVAALKRKPQQTSDAVKVTKPEMYTADEIARDMSAMKNNFVYGFNELESQLVKRTDQLTVLESEIKAQEAKLAEVHEITREADSLAALQYANEQERNTQQRTLSERKAGFDEGMEETKLRWKREAEEYEYTIAKDRARNQEQIDELLNNANKDVDLQREEFERSIQDRLANLDRREAVCEKLEEQMETIEEEYRNKIEDKINQAVSIATTSVKHEYETENKLLTQKVESLQETIESLRSENTELKAELKASNQMANTVAQEAVKSNKVVHISEKQA